MPIYAFECAACGHQFDRLQKLSDPDPRSCPDCAAGSVRRRMTAPAFRLAGSGWYETDFKKDGDRKRNLAAGEGGEGAKAGEAKTDKPADSKGEASPGSKTEPGNGSKQDAKPAARPADTSKPRSEPKPAA